MTFLRKRIFKIVAASVFGAAATGGIVAGLVTGFSSTEDDYSFIVQASAAPSSLNYMRDYSVGGTGGWTLVNAIEGLFSPRLNPTSSPVHQLLGIAPLPFAYYSDDGSAIGDKTAAARTTTISSLVAPGMATTATISSDGPDRIVFDFNIRTDAYWSNGDQVTADDFVNTVKYVILPKTSSRVASILPNLSGYAEMRKVMNEDLSIGLTQLDNDPKYNWFFLPPVLQADGTMHGGNVYSTIVRDPVTNRITSQTVTFTIAAGAPPTITTATNAVQLMSTYSLFYPVNRKFVESIGGYDAFGRTKETFVSNGPFKITQANFDYQVLFQPNEYYWDKERVLNKGFLQRVLNDTTTIQGLFKTGKIGQIIITPDQYRIFAADPEIKRYISKGTTNSLLQGWFYNQDNGPGRAFTRNVHLRRAINYGIDRAKVIAAAGYDGSPPSDIYTTDIRNYTDENGNSFRNVFLDPRAKDESTSYTFTVNGFKQNMVYFDYQTLEELRRRELNSKVSAGFDPQYNPELAKKEFALFEQDMAAQGSQQSVYTLKAILSGTQDEQSVVLMDQSLNHLLGGKLRIEGFFVSASIADNYRNTADPSLDLWPISWGFDTPDPFSYLRLWALTQDPEDPGVKIDVAFGSYLVYTTPKGFSDPNQFPMMDDMERKMGNPTNEADFAAGMKREFGVDWISYQDWKATKDRILAWQSSHIKGRLDARDAKIAKGEDVTNYDVSGVVNTDAQIGANADTQFWFSNGFKTPTGTYPSITINESYRYQAILELVLRIYSASFTTMQAGISAWASTLIGAYSTGSYFGQSSLSQKVSYICSAPPKTQWALPGCEAITDTNLPLVGDK